MKRRGFLNLFCTSTGSCLIPADIARIIREVDNGSNHPAILAPSSPSFDLFAQQQCNSYVLFLGDPNAEPNYPSLREFIWDQGYDPTKVKGLKEYLLEWRAYDEQYEGPIREAVSALRKELDNPISGGERSYWFDWGFEMYDSPMAGAYRFLDELPLADGQKTSGFDFGSLTFIEGDRPGSNLTYVEVDSLSAIASLQHRLNELQTGARIILE